ncbi:MAG: formylglycine-generating enzyme family protein [Gammaproteobacteria bacterium]|nr:formylglycine-generating enzyme family protein [Gammaproteobacteria bacterium]
MRTAIVAARGASVLVLLAASLSTPAQLQPESPAERLRVRADQQSQDGGYAAAVSGRGRTFRECEDCPEMVVIPAGRFRMGCLQHFWREGLRVIHYRYGGRCETKLPVHEITIPRPFGLSKYEVTFAQWDACVASGGCGGYRPDDAGWGRGDRPVVNVSWKDAQSYVKWLSELTGEAYRLPSESEWEYAARAGSVTDYAWGNYIGKNRANCNGCGSRWDSEMTAPVGSFAPNAFGLYDMHGNVWEWVEDCWNESYRGAPLDGGAWLSGNCDGRVLRGGSWYMQPGHLSSANRNWSITANRADDGFRVARTLEP